MRYNDIIPKPISWSSLDRGLTADDKLIIVEEYYTKGNLTESNERHSTIYFVDLFNLSDTPVVNENYIVVPLALITNRIMQLDEPGYMKYLGQDSQDSSFLLFQSDNGKKSYPSKIIRDVALYNTFTFESEEKYDLFRFSLTLKFDTVLSNITIPKTEYIDISRLKTLSGL